MPCAAAGPSTEGVDMTVGIDHNRGEKKYPYAKSRLTTVLGGMEHVQMMNLPHRLMSQLVILLTSVKPDMAAALNLIYGFWICAFKGVYQCQLGRLRMSVRLLVPTPACAQPSRAQPSPPTAHAFCPALPIAAHHKRNQPQDHGGSSLRLTSNGLFKSPHESHVRDLCQPLRRSGVPDPLQPLLRPRYATTLVTSLVTRPYPTLTPTLTLSPTLRTGVPSEYFHQQAPRRWHEVAGHHGRCSSRLR